MDNSPKLEPWQIELLEQEQTTPEREEPDAEPYDNWLDPDDIWEEYPDDEPAEDLDTHDYYED